VFLLATLHLIKTTEMRSVRRRMLPLFTAIGTGAILVWGTLVLPRFGGSEGAIHQHVAPFYIADTVKATNVPNVVTSVLADYRGYDTLGETTVIFTAGIGVLLLLRGMRRRGRRPEDEARP
jgi:multicomponent Na+:H+ antiporter subunit B